MLRTINSIQSEILSKLYYATCLRYAQIRPSQVENDLYNYHLQMLVKKGLVLKSEEGYKLSEEGIKRLTKISPTSYSGQSADLFKVNALCCVLREQNGAREILHQTRTMHPFYGDSQVPGGMARHGERIEEAAARKLKEETGLISHFVLGGVVRGTFYHEHEVLQDILYHVCFADSYEGDLQHETVFGKNYWCSLDTAIELEKRSTAPIQAIIDLYTQLKLSSALSIPFFYHHEIMNTSRI